MNELELEPHEQLDQIDRQTNDDGTVTVDLLGWEKTPNNRVDVQYRVPTGEVRTESMQWPEAKDDSYKFIRLINETPYTLGTADGINSDGSLELNADPQTWRLELPEKPKLRDRIPTPKDELLFEITKFALYPLALVAMIANLMEEDAHIAGLRGGEYDGIYLQDKAHHQGHISALKSAVYLTIWVFIVVTVVL